MFPSITSQWPTTFSSVAGGHDREYEKECNPICRAIIKNDLKELQILIDSGGSINSTDYRGRSVLNLSIAYQRIEIFDYLLTFDDIDIDFRDPTALGSSPFLYVMDEKRHFGRTASIGHFILELLKKNDRNDRTIIEKELYVNAQNDTGETPLHVASASGNIDWIYMLSYYGANATIADHEGRLPIVAVQTVPHSNQQQIQEILFDYAFDSRANTVTLVTLVEAMTHRTPLFNRILEITSDVTYNQSGLEYFCTNVMRMRTEHLRLFVKKYNDIVHEIFGHCCLMRGVLNNFNMWRHPSANLKELVHIFLKSENASDFIRDLNLCDDVICSLSCGFNQIREFFEKCNRNRSDAIIYSQHSYNDLYQTVSWMLSLGLKVSSKDLDNIYDQYGYCELFEMLLHMDVDVKEVKWKKLINMAPLYYDPGINIDEIIDRRFTSQNNGVYVEASEPSFLEKCIHLLEFYNYSKLKENLTKPGFEEIVSRVKKLPDVSSLTELSRNVARKHIAHRYNNKNSRQFYTILKWLPIGETYRKIIALKTKLYILN